MRARAKEKRGEAAEAAAAGEEDPAGTPLLPLSLLPTLVSPPSPIVRPAPASRLLSLLPPPPPLLAVAAVLAVVGRPSMSAPSGPLPPGDSAPAPRTTIWEGDRIISTRVDSMTGGGTLQQVKGGGTQNQ